MELKRTQDLMNNELFRTFYLEGERKGESKTRAEDARALHRKLGLNAEQIADTLEVPLDQVRQWLGQ
jgi:DNA-binding transcriptional regulator YiaG